MNIKTYLHMPLVFLALCLSAAEQTELDKAVQECASWCTHQVITQHFHTDTNTEQTAQRELTTSIKQHLLPVLREEGLLDAWIAYYTAPLPFVLRICVVKRYKEESVAYAMSLTPWVGYDVLPRSFSSVPPPPRAGTGSDADVKEFNRRLNRWLYERERKLYDWYCGEQFKKLCEKIWTEVFTHLRDAGLLKAKK